MRTTQFSSWSDVLHARVSRAMVLLPELYEFQTIIYLPFFLCLVLVHIIQMSCITEATGGAGSYTIVEFFSYDATVATIVVVVACCLLPVTLYLGQKQRRLLKSTPVLSAGAAQVKEWYSTLSLFPSIAAVGCWLSICLPNLGIVFELCYEVTVSFSFYVWRGG
jgi:hypothetical protein